MFTKSKADILHLTTILNYQFERNLIFNLIDFKYEVSVLVALPK